VRDTLYLAWRYVAYHRLETTILITAMTLILYLPIGLKVLVDQSAHQLTARAAATPLLVGVRASPLELVLSSLYFESDPPAEMNHAGAARITASGLADPIPLYVRFRVRSQPIVGTTLEYFDFRELVLASGRWMAVAGECVLGAEAAAILDVDPGDSVVTSPEKVFDVAGVYPLKMRVAGVLQPSLSPDDSAVFVDLKTAWIISGLGHGHQDLARPDASASVLSNDGDLITANASVVEYNEITAANVDSFHFHGELDDYPLTAVIAVPHDERAGVILLGRYQSPDERSQMVRPREVMDELLATILTVRTYVVAAIMIVGLATLATAALVFMLSIRLRRREIETMFKIGGSRGRVWTTLSLEIAVVLLAGAAIAAGLTALTSRIGYVAIQQLLLS